MQRRFVSLAAVFAGAVLSTPALAASSPFDLAGPQVEVSVMRAGRTLPIGAVPNLEAGDQIWIKADVPQGKHEAVRYLLVAAFLRGAANPPPPEWFFDSQTWTRKGEGGMRITVPRDAQELLVFLAPTENGDFNTIRNAVRAKPGAFVRASQDLRQAALDRSRLDAYVAGIRKLSDSDPGALESKAPLLARSLAIRLDPDCLKKAVEAQASCLTQGQDTLVLHEGGDADHDSGELTQLGQTRRGGESHFGPYVAALVDIGHILEGFRTAQYQYIPALTVIDRDRVSLMLNSAPSFRNPKSVLVMALPDIGPSEPPHLHPVTSERASCLQASGLTLVAEGAPLVFSTGFAHDLYLRVNTGTGGMIDLPARADPEKGGLVIDAAGAGGRDLGTYLSGRLHGAWGFEDWDGPSFKLVTAYASQGWRLDPDQPPVAAGAPRTVRLAGDPACVQSVALRDAAGRTEPLAWKDAGAAALEATLPAERATGGPVTLLVSTFGRREPQAVTFSTGALAMKLDGFVFHAGDREGVLKGQGLGEVRTLTLGGVRFVPAPAGAGDPEAGLTLAATDPEGAAELAPGAQRADVALGDGRTIPLPVEILSSRPRYQLISRTVAIDPHAPLPRVALSDEDELPWNGRLTFSVRADASQKFTGGETIELASGPGMLRATLKPGDGLMLQDDQVAVANVDLAKAFGTAAFGPLRYRVVKDGAPGDWAPLGVLVRLPTLTGFNCKPAGDCRLTGENLFLVAEIAQDPEFTSSMTTPEGFTGESLPAPRPRSGRLYVRLRDNPSAVNEIAVSVPAAPLRKSSRRRSP